MTPEATCVKPLIESSGLDNQGRSLKENTIEDLMMRRLWLSKLWYNYS